MTYYLQETMTP